MDYLRFTLFLVGKFALQYKFSPKSSPPELICMTRFQCIGTSEKVCLLKPKEKQSLILQKLLFSFSWGTNKSKIILSYILMESIKLFVPKIYLVVELTFLDLIMDIKSFVMYHSFVLKACFSRIELDDPYVQISVIW